MTKENAIMRLKVIQDSICLCCRPDFVFRECEYCGDKFALDMAIEAIQNSTPQKATNLVFDDEYLKYWNCPNCGIQHSGELALYCDVCGQAIDCKLDN